MLISTVTVMIMAMQLHRQAHLLIKAILAVRVRVRRTGGRIPSFSVLEISWVYEHSLTGLLHRLPSTRTPYGVHRYEYSSLLVRRSVFVYYRHDVHDES